MSFAPCVRVCRSTPTTGAFPTWPPGATTSRRSSTSECRRCTTRRTWTRPARHSSRPTTPRSGGCGPSGRSRDRPRAADPSRPLLGRGKRPSRHAFGRRRRRPVLAGGEGEPPVARGRPGPRPEAAAATATSPSTASRALTGRVYVCPAVRERLVETAARLGYVRHAWALALKQQTSRVIGVVVSELGNQFYAGLASGIEETLRSEGYQMLLVSDNSDSAQELALTRTFLSLRAAGVIMTPVGSEGTAFLTRHA